MKHSFNSMMLVVAAAAITFTGCAVASHTEKAKGIDFNNYKSFALMQSNNTQNNKHISSDIIDNNIKDAVIEQLKKKGMQQVNNNADVLINYNIAAANGTKRESSPVQAYPSLCFGFGGRGRFLQSSVYMGNRTSNIAIRKGILTINMTDAKTNKLIWQGWAEDEINNRNITSKQAAADVKSIIKKINYHG